MPVPVLPEVAAAVCAGLILLMPFGYAGLALMNAGLTRSRSSAHSLMSSLCVAGVAAIAYVVLGFAWQGLPGGPAYALVAGGRAWSWLGAGRFFFAGSDAGALSTPMIGGFSLFACVFACLIPLGSGEERWRLRASALSTAFFAAWTFPLFAHWVWGGGWLASLGLNFGIGSGFIDPGGGGTMQVLGGFAALSIAWLLGARRAKFSSDGMPMALPGHNVVFVTFGCFLALVGWFGLNSAGAMLFYGAPLTHVPLIAVNTFLTAGSALLSAAIVTGVRFGKPDASLSANGWTAGLAASSACAAFQVPPEALIVGLVAGALVPFCVEWLELRFKIDDPAGSISVHAVGGLWGLVASAFLGRFPGAAPHQWLAQFIGIATLLGFMLPLIYGSNWVLNRIFPYRVPPEGERQGMDLHELGANAYPELVSHLEDFQQR